MLWMAVEVSNSDIGFPPRALDSLCSKDQSMVIEDPNRHLQVGLPSDCDFEGACLDLERISVKHSY